MTTNPAQAVEIALRGVTLSEQEAARLTTLIATRVRPTSAHERLDTFVDGLPIGSTGKATLRRLIRETLGAEAMFAVHAAEAAYDEQQNGAEVVLAVRQAMFTDRIDR